MDVDSTLIQDEVIELLADEAGVLAKVTGGMLFYNPPPSVLAPTAGRVFDAEGGAVAYEVQPGDFDANGITLASPVDLNGGSITDIAGNPASATACALACTRT